MLHRKVKGWWAYSRKKRCCAAPNSSLRTDFLFLGIQDARVNMGFAWIRRYPQMSYIDAMNVSQETLISNCSSVILPVRAGHLTTQQHNWWRQLWIHWKLTPQKISYSSAFNVEEAELDKLKPSTWSPEWVREAVQTSFLWSQMCFAPFSLHQKCQHMEECRHRPTSPRSERNVVLYMLKRRKM